MSSLKTSNVRDIWLGLEAQILQQTRLICQVYQHINVYRYSPEWMQMTLRYVLWEMDFSVGLSTSAESRRPKYDLLVSSGRLRVLKDTIDWILQWESIQEANYARNIGDCRTIHEAFYVLLRPKNRVRLRLMQVFMAYKDIVDRPWTWRNLWGATEDTLGKCGERAWLFCIARNNEQALQGYQGNDDNRRESGHDHEVRFMEQPDAFNILGSILYPRAVDNGIPRDTQPSSVLEVSPMNYNLPIQLRHPSSNTQSHAAQTIPSEPPNIRESRNPASPSHSTSGIMEVGEMQHDLGDNLRRMSISSSGTQTHRRDSGNTSDSINHILQQQVIRRRSIDRSRLGSRVVALTPIRRRSSYRNLTRGPPIGRHHRRVLATQEVQRTQSRMIFFRAFMSRAAENRRLRCGLLKSRL